MFISTAGELSSAEIPTKILNLAQALARKHGDVHISREDGGIHLNMASPKCLEEDGLIELDPSKRHLAVNADKYFALGKWASKIGTYDNDRCARCMKYATVYNVSELLKMVPLSDRGFKTKLGGAKVSIGADNSNYLEDDGNGNMVAAPPGKVIPITMLPSNHPAAEYLTARGFDLGSLEAQFDTSYCFEELPECEVRQRHYRRLPGGFKDTPQGRIIFYADMLGVRRGWQARVLDRREDTSKWYWHPYEKEWVATANLEGEEWVPTPRFVTTEKRDGTAFKFDPSKYRISRGASRNKLIIGLDAALKWNQANRKPGQYIIFICEGPLDAGRLGAPAVAILGKFLSEDQATIIAKFFNILVYVADNDKAGIEGANRIRKRMADKDLKFLYVPDEYKDIGETPQDVAEQLKQQFL